MKDYPIDIAISLCQEDLAYAKKLRKELNPKLNVFLYEERQEDLLGKDGLVEFGKKFRDEARIVVVLYRSRWGETLYTGIEQEALLDRIKKSKDGPGFIVMIPMEVKEAPFWYPRSRIYADPERFSPEQIARWIEFKFQEHEGVVEPLSLEDKIASFKAKEKQRMEQIRFLESKESGAMALEELRALIKKVNKQIDFLTQQAQLNCEIRYKHFSEAATHSWMTESAEMALENHRIEFQIRHSNVTNFRDTSLAFQIAIRYFSNTASGYQKVWQEVAAKSYRFNTDIQHLSGWSEVLKPQHNRNDRKMRFYYSAEDTYDLGPIIPTAELVEKQFIWLFEQMENGYKKLLNL